MPPGDEVVLELTDGIRLGQRRTFSRAPDGPFDLTIQIAHHEVVGQVTAVRVTPTDLGLQFGNLARDDRLLLASLALAYHRHR